MCGLAGLEWEERQAKANQILVNTEWKQKLCNELVGLSFRELERALRGIASERQKKEESYERKLDAYRTGASPKRPGTGHRSSSDRATGPKSTQKGSLQRSPPRSLEEILAQVYAPRESAEVLKGRARESVLALFQKTSAEEDQDLLQRPDDGYSFSEEEV